MLTKEQEAWLEHLSNNPTIIVPYNPYIKVVFDIVRSRLHDILGSMVEVLHRGTSQFEISGQGDLDIYVLAYPIEFDAYHVKIADELGEASSYYPRERARWNLYMNDIRIEVMLVNRLHPDYQKSEIFEEYLREHPDALQRYKKLKEDANGVSRREYYRRKLEFINEILKKASTK